MITIILFIHILLAVVSLVFATGVIIATKKLDLISAHNRTRPMWRGTLATLVSGLILAAAAHAAFGRTCLMMTTFLLVVLAAHYYERSVRLKTGCPYLDEQ